MNTGDRSLVRNAADKRQVDRAAKRERDDRELELVDLKAVLSLPEGRRVIWRMLEHTRTFGSIYDDTPTKIAFNSGRQDVGHFLMAEIAAADDNALLLMMQENQARDRKRNATVDATHTRAATEEPPEETTDADS